LLTKLGFLEAKRIGIGGHAHKFKHPTRETSDPKYKSITIPSKIHKDLSKQMVKEVMKFGFTKEEIKNAC